MAGNRLAQVRAQDLAAYYIWSALRGHDCSGRSPRTGGLLKGTDINLGEAVELSRLLYVVKARHFIARARHIRTTWRPARLP